jgi:hypothetical protein
MPTPRGLAAHHDAQGRLKSWPAKRQAQLAALKLLAARFEPGRRYTEPEVRDVLAASHTFGDWALLRRALVDYGYLERAADGSAYWRSGR